MSSVHSNAEQGDAAASLLVHQSLIKILSLQGHVAHLILCNPGEEIWMREMGEEKRKLPPCAVTKNTFIDSRALVLILKERAISFSGISGSLLCRGVCMLEV